jgi:hypothetical protein
MKYILISLLFAIIKTQDEEGLFEEEQPKIIPQQQEVSLVDKTKNKIFYCFEFLEYYIIKLHNYIKQDLHVEYPLDLLCFVLIGIVLYYILSNFKSKVICKFTYRQIIFIILRTNQTIIVTSEM